MKKILLLFLILLLCCCNKNESGDTVNSVNVIINDENYELVLENNATVSDFLNLLPLQIYMNDLNNNEKYYYLDNSLITNSYKPNHINKGDVMLFNDNCLVIFYKSFDTSYSYTKIGNIKNLPDLDNDNVSIKIEK